MVSCRERTGQEDDAAALMEFIAYVSIYLLWPWKPVWMLASGIVVVGTQRLKGGGIELDRKH